MSLLIQLLLVSCLAVAFQCAPVDDQPSSTTPKFRGTVEPDSRIISGKSKESSEVEDKRTVRDTQQSPHQHSNGPTVGLPDPNKYPNYPKPQTQQQIHSNNRHVRETPTSSTAKSPVHAVPLPLPISPQNQQTKDIPKSGDRTVRDTAGTAGPKTGPSRPTVGLADPAKYGKPQTLQQPLASKPKRETGTSTTSRTTVHAVPLPLPISPQNQKTKDIPKGGDRAVRDTYDRKPPQVASSTPAAKSSSPPKQQAYRNYSN